LVKTTLEIPDSLFRKAKSKAAERGQSLKDFVTEALTEKLTVKHSAAGEPAWMKGFGGLAALHRETARIQRCIDEVFDVVESEDRA
jgi:hypothetical protein